MNALSMLQHSASLSRVASGIPSLDLFFEGGLPSETLIEWGVPLGGGGRRVVISYLASISQQVGGSVLWVYRPGELQVYPPAWQAQGVNLERVRFAGCENVVADLRPVFFDSLFSVVVIDNPKALSMDEWAFLARQARQHKFSVWVLRNYLLRSELGNVWARWRVNAEPVRQPRTGTQQCGLSVVRGLSPRKMLWEASCNT